MSSLNIKECLDIIFSFGEAMDRAKMVREAEFRRKRAEMQNTDFHRRFRAEMDKVKNETINKPIRFDCTAEDAEFEEV